MHTQPILPPDPELERLLIEEDIINIERKLASANNSLASAKKMREESPRGSASESITETEIEEICSSIDVLNAQLQAKNKAHNELSIRLSQARTAQFE